MPHANGFGFVPGNQIALLHNGDAYFPAIEAAIDRASYEIYVETYIYENDDIGQRIADALKRAVLCGVKVHVLLDGFGSKDLPVSMLDRFRSDGVQALVYPLEHYAAHVLIGQLLLQDFTVAKVMLTAILVGMVGIFTLHHFAKVNLHLKPTRIGANVIGGLVFGAGFALTGYCPGTAAAALGQGSWDALFGIAGLIAGSWLFAELSGWSKRTIETWGDLGKVLLPDLLHVPRAIFVVGFAVALTALLLLIHRLT